ncbi:hypothetical protein C2S52_007866 [Perilla frutescens var. hirtella]|uniref:Uncharacterized protein n=1 Tax=Perilla frutescens var. hirtella TaxID=608512 RepID=A0AAD4P4C1_PERFH|nr:hypothetical protein C2S52_007866 [Perilla frutescens var. hirtella]KAH6826314.1 hypothetical protein C2S53_017663 [Perilla frutescens var. hirtella]
MIFDQAPYPTSANLNPKDSPSGWEKNRTPPPHPRSITLVDDFFIDSLISPQSTVAELKNGCYSSSTAVDRRFESRTKHLARKSTLPNFSYSQHPWHSKLGR